MRSFLTTICNKTIEYSFYLLFLLVPLVITSRTSELFEFNKMWVTFGLTTIIVTAWICKMILEKRFFIKRTPLDIPLSLFLLSQTISTLFSLDTHISLWGYYSRFNGGFFSILSFVLLFYAFVSNLEKKHVIKSLYVSLISGTIVALWGLPSHFGYDPTCFIFRNSLDVSCWTEAFQPKIRIFSTLGQPNWLAIYLAIILPIAIGLGLTTAGYTKHVTKNNTLFFTGYLLLVALLYVAILYTGSRSGFVGLAAGMGATTLMFSFVFRKHIQKPLLFFLVGILSLFVVFSFLQGTPFTKPLTEYFNTNQLVVTKPVVQGPALETGGTESGTIRLIVWQGAIDAWKKYPLFGSGVETFAFAYYQSRPVAHNLTSEWDYLYNKAHNEYLNYLTTTGAFGLGSYLLVIGTFFYTFFSVISSRLSVLSQLLTGFQFISHKQTNRETEKQKTENGQLKTDNRILSLALLASYIAILVSNFFGFSVVIVNIYFFLIPAFVLLLLDVINPNSVFLFPKHLNKETDKRETVTAMQWIGISAAIGVSLYLLIMLILFWVADTRYAYGNNLDHAGQYQYATEYLTDAVNIRPDEPTFQDELSLNSAVLSLAYYNEKEASIAAEFAQQALVLSNNVVQNHPNNITFWKTRTRIFTALAQIEPQYITVALDAIQHAANLAPTDAKVQYNLALLQAESSETKKAIATLEKTVQLKPDYADARFKLGELYHTQAIDKNGNVIKPDMQQKAVKSLRFILENIASQDAQTIKKLQEWGEK